VIIETAPLRLTFQNRATDRTVLEEVSSARLPTVGAQLFPVLFSPKAPGEGRPVYEPLAFQYGGQTSQQLIPSETQGDQTAAAQGGVVFAPENVTGVQPVAGGYRLTVATSDPTRTMTVLITRDVGSAIRVRASLSNASYISGFSDSFIAHPGEAFHGFGGRHNSLDQAGNSFYSWPEEESIDCGAIAGRVQSFCAQIPGGGGNAYQLPNGADETYYPQNEFVSSHGYSFLLNEPQLTRWRMAAEDRSKWQVNVAGPSLDYSVVVGQPQAALRGLTAIAGSQVRPPVWAEGATVSRAWNVVSDNPSRYHDEVLSDLVHIEHDRLPIKAYAYEAWRGQDPGFVRSVNARLRHDGVHAIGYLRAFVYPDNTSFDNQATYDQAKAGGYGARTSSGGTYYFTCNYGPNCILVDFSNPAARAWWAGRVSEMLDLGFDGFMQDFGEQVTTDMHFYDGETGATMHNNYPVLYHQTTRQVIERYMREHPGRKVFFYTRAGYSGRPGSVAYDNGSFPGDETVSWTAGTGLPAIVPDMLNRSVGGGLGYDTDLGGYTGLPGGYTQTPELWLRWNEAGVFTPYFRVHNATIIMPWDSSLPPGTEATWARLAALHNRARPLMQRLWRRYPKTGIPPTSPLWLMFPDDVRAARTQDEWMVGRDLLVAPVLSQGAFSRSVYFPRGCWFDPQAGLSYAGPSSRSVAAPLAKLPFFFRCGTDPLGRGSGRSCPRAGGRIHGRSLGPISLGERRGRLRRRYARFSTRRRRDMDFYCLAPHGIRVGFHGRRAVLALTANRHYAIRGIRPGLRLAVAARRVRLLGPFHVGLNFWYLVPGHNATGVLKVRRGRIQEIGIADKRLTTGRRRAMRFLESFR
jgi:alpha-glucosidase (family GH31 glycosyl hydrolase)